MGFELTKEKVRRMQVKETKALTFRDDHGDSITVELTNSQNTVKMTIYERSLNNKNETKTASFSLSREDFEKFSERILSLFSEA